MEEVQMHRFILLLGGLTLTLGGGERAYSVRGRDPRLLDFAEMAAERLMTAAR